jgi:hypothetical protein
MVVGVLQRRARALFLNYKKTSFAKAIACAGGKSDNGNQLYLHYKYDSSNLSFSN